MKNDPLNYLIIGTGLFVGSLSFGVFTGIIIAIIEYIKRS